MRSTTSIKDQGMIKRRQLDKVIRLLFFTAALCCIVTLFAIMFFLLFEGLPLFKTVNFKDFLFGMYWYPTFDPPEFGILPMIAGSLAVTVISAVFAIPIGIMTAIYLSELASPGIRQIAKPMVEMLQALPSVVVGFFGLVVIAPFLQEQLDLPTGLNIFNASLMLAFMAVPTITSLAEDALHEVPRELREASLALGATRWQTTLSVVLPAASSGISTAIILGMSRSIGETMVVLMVAGGAAIIPDSLFSPARPMPASIAAEMGETPFHSEHYYALFATGLVLFLFTLCFNILAAWIAEKRKHSRL